MILGGLTTIIIGALLAVLILKIDHDARSIDGLLLALAAAMVGGAVILFIGLFAR